MFSTAGGEGCPSPGAGSLDLKLIGKPTVEAWNPYISSILVCIDQDGILRTPRWLQRRFGVMIDALCLFVLGALSRSARRLWPIPLSSSFRISFSGSRPLQHVTLEPTGTNLDIVVCFGPTIRFRGPRGIARWTMEE
ncbi:uncharacterized protein N7459_008378 [Penicillium hispanicum]|uniref:uncharacterized protein n=1 Tax=Penicillium hispanicum TaxID=1080232 RepID=UPI0025404D03|nr:uncharacterized protein N7459_008378 [Penicillium hispanicum]KAJ5573951.1 hypothetical protein N7459_008378 [Penicillium hispanicum]